MFEEMTYENILFGMLKKVDNEMDKREGSVVFDMLSPIAMELAEHYAQLEGIFSSFFIASATDGHLDRLGIQFGILRREATKAVKKGVFYGVDGGLFDVAIGNRFHCGDLTFVVKKWLEAGTFELECEQAGADANNVNGDMFPLNNIGALKSGVLTETIFEGRNKESDEKYKDRFVTTVSRPAFGGNVSDYLTETTAINGVGFVAVYPAFLGGGSVGLVLGGERGREVAAELVTKVGAHYSGAGNEQNMAPIGHAVTVKNCTNKEIVLSIEVVPKEGMQLEDMKQDIEEKMRNYIDGIGFLEEQIYIVKLIGAVLAVDGVEDVPINRVKINGIASNLKLQKNMTAFEVPVYKSAVIGVG